MWGEVAREIGCGVLGGIRCRVRLGGPNRIPKISARSPAVVFWWRHVRLFRSMARTSACKRGRDRSSPPSEAPAFSSSIRSAFPSSSDRSSSPSAASKSSLADQSAFSSSSSSAVFAAQSVARSQSICNARKFLNGKSCRSASGRQINASLGKNGMRSWVVTLRT